MSKLAGEVANDIGRGSNVDYFSGKSMQRRAALSQIYFYSIFILPENPSISPFTRKFTLSHHALKFSSPRDYRKLAYVDAIGKGQL
jgi:hypothetical protein